MHICIINGPNLNLLGKRETDIYGNQPFEGYFKTLEESFSKVELSYFQSNIEGELIDHIQKLMKNCDGIVINAAAYSHTSVGIADALAAVQLPTVEVHISNVHAREAYRQQLLTAANCLGVISGLGLMGYELALRYLINTVNNTNLS
jgi:3-dehydroquinate dehydratase-2